MTTTRRTVLCLAGAACGTSALGACSGSDSGDGTGSTPSEVRIPVADVPEGGGLVRDRVVVTQPSAGEFAAFDVRCPHQGCAVDEVTSKAIVCPCHGSQFALTDGAVVQGPATTGLTERTVTVDGTDVVVS